MDPQAAWDELLSAYVDADWAVVEERACALRAWLDSGGFPPTVLPQTGLGPEWNRALARAGCLHALRTCPERGGSA